MDLCGVTRSARNRGGYSALFRGAAHEGKVMYNVWVSSVTPGWGPIPNSTCNTAGYTYWPQPVLTEKRWLPAGHEPSWKRGIWT